MNPKIFPIIMIALSLLASCSYFFYRDIRRGFYWLASAVLIFTVTFCFLTCLLVTHTT